MGCGGRLPGIRHGMAHAVDMRTLLRIRQGSFSFLYSFLYSYDFTSHRNTPDSLSYPHRQSYIFAHCPGDMTMMYPESILGRARPASIPRICTREGPQRSHTPLICRRRWRFCMASRRRTNGVSLVALGLSRLALTELCHRGQDTGQDTASTFTPCDVQ